LPAGWETGQDIKLPTKEVTSTRCAPIFKPLPRLRCLVYVQGPMDVTCSSYMISPITIYLPFAFVRITASTNAKGHGHGHASSFLYSSGLKFFLSLRSPLACTPTKTHNPQTAKKEQDNLHPLLQLIDNFTIPRLHESPTTPTSLSWQAVFDGECDLRPARVARSKNRVVLGVAWPPAPAS
jgi:hypothetical protein